ncbi:MAG: FtsX-like permease family protein [Blastocatellia bacterium]|nr:FtsX-like permease family protein [Blastocatellia bacterium]
MFNRLPIAVLQLIHEKPRFFAAIAGIAFANILMFLQFGFQDALFESATIIQRKLRADLVLISTNSEVLFSMNSFSRRRLYQVLSHEEVSQVTPMYVGLGTWKNPWNGRTRSLLVMGFDPKESVLDLPGITENLPQLYQSDTVLFDRRSREEFGQVADEYGRGNDIFTEVNRNKIKVGGLFTLGASFAADGNLVTSELNFLRMFEDRHPEAINIGVINLKPGVDAIAFTRKLEKELPKDVRALTHDEFAALERNYWETSTAIGFIFNLGVSMGFLIGLVISYQILHTDVVNHLQEYATLKAMGYKDIYFLGVVFQESLLLSAIGYLPGIGVSFFLFRLIEDATFLPMQITPYRAVLVLVLTVTMCFVSGAIAMRKLRKADPAEIF